tara:strand:- start:6920 stop:7327 length:408 start_codon:yes stop_codon:yes gene_type:complete
MFELVNHIEDVKLIEKDAVVECKKTKEEWRDELLDFGLINDRKFFFVPNNKSKLKIAFADVEYVKRLGIAPRISIPKSTVNGDIFTAVCDEYGLNVIHNFGLTFEGYDFKCGKSAQELSSFLVGFENAYRKIALG